MWLKQKMISAVNRESTVNDLMWVSLYEARHSMLDDVEGNWHIENIQMKHWDSFTLDWLLVTLICYFHLNNKINY